MSMDQSRRAFLKRSALVSAAAGAGSGRTIPRRAVTLISCSPRVPSGCAFHPRCAHAVSRCREVRPELRETISGRMTACHRAEELTLTGVE